MVDQKQTEQPQENKPKKKRFIVSEAHISFQGPLPHPQILKQYDQVYPGAAKIIFTLVSAQSKHRQELEKKVIASDIQHERLGMYFAFIITVTMIIGGIILIMLGKSVPTGITGFFVIFLPAIFQGYNFYQKKQDEKKELKQKENEKPPE